MEKSVVELFAGVGGFRCGLNNVELINNKVKAKKYTTHFDLLPCDDEISNAIEKLKENNIEFWDRIDELFKFQIPSNPKFNLAPNEENRTTFGDNECWKIK